MFFLGEGEQGEHERMGEGEREKRQTHTHIDRERTYRQRERTHKAASARNVPTADAHSWRHTLRLGQYCASTELVLK